MHRRAVFLYSNSLKCSKQIGFQRRLTTKVELDFVDILQAENEPYFYQNELNANVKTFD